MFRKLFGGKSTYKRPKSSYQKFLEKNKERDDKIRAKEEELKKRKSK